MRNTKKFTNYVNWGALVLLLAAVVALLCTERLPKDPSRDLASKSAPVPTSETIR